MRIFEIPFIIEIPAESREEAEDIACDVADAIGDTFIDSVGGVSAIISQDHNILDRLYIDYEGTEIDPKT